MRVAKEKSERHATTKKRVCVGVKPMMVSVMEGVILMAEITTVGAVGYIYEHAVVLSVKIEDQDAFERGFFSVETLLYRCTDMNREANPFIAIPLCWFLNFISSVVLNLACERQVALAVSMERERKRGTPYALKCGYIYEHAVVLSVKIEDQDAFERDFFQLKPYYTDAHGRLPPSPQEYPILGLNLLRLLVQNRIAEFHTELELLSAGAMENNCIKHAVELEQSFMEGAYNRVLSARQTVPHETYVYFMDLLAKTVRDEIAGCSEKAYDSLSINDARKILLFSSDKELFEYVKELNLFTVRSAHSEHFVLASP
ncbi:hypothetical protein TEA_003386 [Camellia sinensis var. sinensis]|uniref:PCI domain-containing protein n=1 Tax=Camellia sinensis var. sinensis TaxID=542762 RepID=A0A4S4DC75_CAMSN|nr:hypothetical protein TEA_003386 [Camellia sinensis var. sinensis]